MEPTLEKSLAGLENGRWLAGLVIGVVLLCVYYPVLSFDYLYHDDWIHFAGGRRPACSASPMYGWSMVTGRPLGQYVICGLFGVFNRTDKAWRARLIILVAIAVFAFLQSRFFRTLGIGVIGAICLALGTSLLPGMLVFGYWITAGSIVFSLVASVAAVLLTEAVLRSEKGVAVQLALAVGAITCQTTALLIYQTQAMYFWTLTAVMLATRLPQGLRSTVRPLAAYIVAGAAPTVGYFIWFRYLSGFAPLLEARDPGRGAVFQDVAGGARWFLGAALPRASLLWFFDFPRGIGLGVLALFVLSLVLVTARLWSMTRQNDRTSSLLSAAYPLVIVTFGLLSFLPMLVTSFRLEVFRSLIPLSALLYLIGAIHLGMILRADRWPPIAKLGIAAGFLLGVSCFASNSLTGRMVLPAAAEYSFVRVSLLETAQRGQLAHRVHAIVPRATHPFTTDEVGTLSTQFRQDVLPMILGVGHDLGLPPSAVSQTILGEPFEQNGVLILDFAELAKSGLWMSAAGPE